VIAVYSKNDMKQVITLQKMGEAEERRFCSHWTTA